MNSQASLEFVEGVLEHGVVISGFRHVFLTLESGISEFNGFILMDGSLEDEHVHVGTDVLSGTGIVDESSDHADGLVSGADDIGSSIGSSRDSAFDRLTYGVARRRELGIHERPQGILEVGSHDP